MHHAWSQATRPNDPVKVEIANGFREVLGRFPEKSPAGICAFIALA
jgi:hypothetical protein